MGIPLLLYRILADVLVLLHLSFIAFVLVGGLLVLRWKYLSIAHIPAVLWAAWVEYQGWVCPLTPLENWFRQKGGMGEYEKSFIDQYLVPVLYPASLNREWQMVLGTLVIVINVMIYALVWHRFKRRSQ